MQGTTEEIHNRALRGDARAMNNIANRYYLGYQSKKDMAKALKWWDKAIKAGDTDALVHMGMLHDAGDGVKKNPVKARILFEKAATAGNTEALRVLGIKATGKNK